MIFILRSAVWGVLAAPLRSLAVATAIASAACCAIFCSAIIGGFDRTLEEMTYGAASRSVTVRTSPAVASAVPPTSADVVALRKAFPQVTSTASWLEGTAAVRGAQGTSQVPVYGVEGDYRTELSTTVSAGRWLSDREIVEGDRACLVGEASGDDVSKVRVGDLLHLGGVSCEVVGRMDYPRARPARRFSYGVVMPAGLVRRYFADPSIERTDLSAITLHFPDEADADDARRDVDKVLRKLHGVPQSRMSPFSYGDTDAALQDQQRQRLMMDRLLRSICGLVLFASTVSYVTIMLSSWRARRREFAIRLAMGALARDVTIQVVLENLMLSAFGALSGLFAGITMAHVAASSWGWPAVLSMPLSIGVMTMALSAAVVIGIAGGRASGATPPAAAAR